VSERTDRLPGHVLPRRARRRPSPTASACGCGAGPGRRARPCSPCSLGCGNCMGRWALERPHTSCRPAAVFSTPYMRLGSRHRPSPAAGVETLQTEILENNLLSTSGHTISFSIKKDASVKCATLSFKELRV
jgi:hypothetical protein